MTAMMDKTTTDTPVTTGTVTVKGKGALVGMLTDLALTADTDRDALEPFTVIRLHTEGGRLHGWSSDRFRAAHAAVDVEGELSAPVNIGADDVANLAKTFRQAMKVTVRVDTADMVAEFAADGLALTVPLRPMTSSGLGEMLPRIAVDTLPEESAALVTFAPQYLETFVKVGKRRKCDVRIVAGATANRPAHVRIGPDYRAWLMPMRVPNGDADWLPSVF